MAIVRPPRAYEEGYYVWGGDIGATYYAEASPRCGLPDVASNVDVLDLLNTLVANLGATYGNKITIGPGVFNGGLRTMVDDCEAGWVSDQGANVVVTYDNVDFQEGTQCVVLTMNAAAGVGLLAHRDLAAPVDISEYQANGFWFKPSIGLSTGDFELCFDNTAGCGTPEVVVDIRHPEGLDAGVWKFGKAHDISQYFPLDLTGVGTLRSIGIRQAVDKGAMNCKVDEINLLRGTIWNTVDKPVWLEGSGTEATRITLNARANTTMYFNTADHQKVLNLSWDGDGGNQDAIDGCPALVPYTTYRSLFENLYLYDFKGTGVVLRDSYQSVIKHLYGLDIENPVVGLNGSVECMLDYVRGENGLDDDIVWCLQGSQGNKGKIWGDTPSSNVLRIDGDPGAQSNDNEFIVFGLNAPGSIVQITTNCYGNKVTAYGGSGCLLGVSVQGDQNTVGGELNDITNQAFQITGDKNRVINGSSENAGRNAIEVTGDDTIITGFYGEDDGTGWDGVRINGGLRTVISGSKFTGFTGGGMRGIKEQAVADFTRAVGNDLSGNAAPADMLGASSIFKDCYGLNPLGKIATPFDAANNAIEYTGGAATPVANTDYYIRHMDIIIESGNSGNNDNAILIKDEAGVTVIGGIAPLSTIDALSVPARYRINWGNFTGAAPTVNVGFN